MNRFLFRFSFFFFFCLVLVVAVSDVSNGDDDQVGVLVA
jgi:hypothetical protein